MEDAVTAFKKFKDIVFLLEPRHLIVWGKNDATKLPNNKIFGGMQGAPRPTRTFSPYEIKRVECTKPGLFRKGTFTVYGQDDKILVEFSHQYKENCANAETFNHYLELYRAYHLPE